MTYFPDQDVKIDDDLVQISLNGEDMVMLEKSCVPNLTFINCRRKADLNSGKFMGKFTFSAQKSGSIGIYITKDGLGIINLFKHAIGSISGITDNGSVMSGYITKTQDLLIFKLKIKKRKKYNFNFNIDFYN